ncbi:MAG: gliding motility-associated C-terminal domain-containing protein [Chitinophagaceae bacterium]|nr:gliding motility-associated C-terminal domain-containing protein [Chitinophagaceae bacterium]MCB9046718.1 gliding motility-associated C-terminal domain-containing protein [Chitinophagales bacterium]
MISGTTQKLSLVVIIALLLAIIPNVSKACHLAAADMYIEYAGKGVNVCNPQPDYTYRVTLITYSYCNCGLTTSTTGERVYYQSANDGGPALSQLLPADPMDTVDQLCPTYSLINQCRVPGNAQYPGFYRLKYTGIITLPSGQSDWRFWWSSSARNPSTNLAGTGSLYIEAGMDVLSNYYNNTPRFLSNPLPYICANQPYNYLNLPWDPDPWDSNKVNVITSVPLNGANNPINHAAGYSPTSPISGYSLNNSTGTATFTPSVTGQYTLSFRASDKSSYIIRDVQIAVLPCTASPPKMDTVAQNLENATLVPVDRKDGTKRIDSIVYACPGSKIQFNLNGWTDDPTNNVYMRSDLSLFTGAGFTSSGSGSSKVTSTFTWTPGTGDYGQHILVVTTVDSSCKASQPIVLTTNAVILIWVVPGIDAGPDQTICELNPQPVQLFVKGSDNLHLKWSMVDGGPVIGFQGPDMLIHNPTIRYPHIDGGDTIFNPKTSGYIVATSDLVGTCKARDTVWVSLDTTNTVTITPKNIEDPENALVICRPTYLQLEALIKGRRPLDNAQCGISKISTICDLPGTKPDTLDFYGSPLYGQAFYDTVGDVAPTMYTTVRSSVKQYLVTKEDLWEWGLRSAAINALGFEMTGFNGTSHTYSNFTISFKCTDTKELSREKGFENFGMQTVYTATNETLTDGAYIFKFKDAYNWDTTKNLIIQLCFSNTTPVACDPANPVPVIKYAPTTYVSGLSYKPANNVTDFVCNTGKDPDIMAGKARPLFKFAYCETMPRPFDIKWKEGEYLSDSTIAQPLAYVKKSGRYIVQTIGRSTCIMRDTLEVYVPEHDVKVEPLDTAFCLGDKAPFTIYGGKFYKWYEYDAANDSFLAPVSVTDPTKGFTYIGPQRSTDYRIVVSDSVWCYDTLAARIKILPLPDVRILNKDDTTIKYGQSFQILATGARLYNWSPVSSLNNPNISYPIARPTEDTKYIVGGIATNGCRAFDTLNVIVDKKDNLFVPSAFSPNGDGKNDIFRVTNLSFQRIMEFRVFNRWGIEVFSTNDSRMGWDGTYQGKPQDIGTYTYLIRVAYPDGFVETYKGETTLIR